MTEASDSGALVSKLLVGAVVAMVVGAVAAFSGIGIPLVVLAVVGAVAAFWLLDALLTPSPVPTLDVAPGARGGDAARDVGRLAAAAPRRGGASGRRDG